MLSIVENLSGVDQFSTAQIEAQLNGDVLTPNIGQVFQASGITLSNATIVTGSGSGPWTLKDGSSTYTVTQSGNVLDVSVNGMAATPLADIAAVSFVGLEMEMATGMVTSDLTAVLVASGINLTSATVTPAASGKNWTVSGMSGGNPRTYVLQVNASGGLAARGRDSQYRDLAHPDGTAAPFSYGYRAC